MPLPTRPFLRPVDVIPYGREEYGLFAFHDPDGFSAPLIVLHVDLVLSGLMDGQRTWDEIRASFQSQTGAAVSVSRLERLLRQLDEGFLLTGQRFEDHRRRVVEQYLAAPVRSAMHAGSSYEPDANDLRQQLADCFTAQKGPGPINSAASRGSRKLRGVVAPHIDLYRGGPATAWAYKAIHEETDADLFVILGTAHRPMREPFCATRKDFDTPLGVVRNDGPFVRRLAGHLASSEAGRQIDLFADEVVHRFEHSIEFQAVFLQYVLGPQRRFRIVPVLTNSFESYVDHGSRPDDAPEFGAFLDALQSTSAEHAGSVCFIGAADLAHIGRRFGDQHLLTDDRLAQQSNDDRLLLDAARRCDANGVYQHVANQRDRNRICGLAPIYTLLKLLEPSKGNLLAYDHAVEPDGTSCVSFASLGFYES